MKIHDNNIYFCILFRVEILKMKSATLLTAVVLWYVIAVPG